MRTLLTVTVSGTLVLAIASSAYAQLGIERRVDRRQERRADAGNPVAAAKVEARATDPRMRWYNNQWWYYTPQNQWVYYYNNAWVPYDPATYLPPREYYIYGNYNYGPATRGRYYTGYRGMWGPPGTSNFGANAGANVNANVNAPAGAQTGAAENAAHGAAANQQAPAPAQPGAAAPNQPAPQRQGALGAPSTKPAPDAQSQPGAQPQRENQSESKTQQRGAQSQQEKQPASPSGQQAPAPKNPESNR